MDGVKTTGEPLWFQDQLVLLEENGKLNEGYYTWSYSPVYYKSRVEGILTTAFKITPSVINERRMRCMRDMATYASSVTELEGVFKIISKSLSTVILDIPFLSLYQVNPATKESHLEITLKETIEIPSGTSLSPLNIENSSLLDPQSKLTASTILAAVSSGFNCISHFF